MHLTAIAVLGALIGHASALKIAVGGAMDPQANNHSLETVQKDFVGGSFDVLQPVTVNIRNLFGSSLQVVVVNAANSPAWGQSQTIEDNLSFTLPVHGNGQITIGHNTNPLGSKIELNNGFETTAPQVYLDVSYVDGFSVPVACHCGGLRTGCSKPLFVQAECPSLQPGPLCVNNAPDDGPPDPFFAPCRDKAYVISNQSGLGTGNYCASNVIDCCIGVRCATRQRQTTTARRMTKRQRTASP